MGKYFGLTRHNFHTYHKRDNNRNHVDNIDVSPKMILYQNNSFKKKIFEDNNIEYIIDNKK